MAGERTENAVNPEDGTDPAEEDEEAEPSEEVETGLNTPSEEEVEDVETGLGDAQDGEGEEPESSEEEIELGMKEAVYLFAAPKEEPDRLLVQDESGEVEYDTDAVVISTSGDYTVSGTGFGGNNVQIVSGSGEALEVSLTLDNVTIGELESGLSAIEIGEQCRVELTVVGDVSLTGGQRRRRHRGARKLRPYHHWRRQPDRHRQQWQRWKRLRRWHRAAPLPMVPAATFPWIP